MKTFLTFCCLIFATTNAFTLVDLRDMLEESLMERDPQEEITLREYLEDLDEPHELSRTLSKRADDAGDSGAAVVVDVNPCSDICGPLAPLKLKDTCAANKWTPNYLKKEFKGTVCECLKDYTCCKECGKEEPLTKCHADKQKGLKYGIYENDCCGCKVLKCLDCDPVDTKKERCPKNELKLKCYKYVAHATHKKDDACFEASCEKAESKAPKDEECDKSCMKSVTKADECEDKYEVCEESRSIEDCALRTKAANEAKLSPESTDCYHEPTEVDDDAGGVYFSEISGKKECAKCQKWDYKQKGCEAEAAAAALIDCHGAGENEMDKSCFKKIEGKDKCGCPKADCEAKETVEGPTFGKDQICPKNHKKVAGVSICMKRRDVCYECPTVVKPDCKFGQLEKIQGCNDCEEWKCNVDTIPEADCACHKYLRFPLLNALYCDCNSDADNLEIAAARLQVAALSMPPLDGE